MFFVNLMSEQIHLEQSVFGMLDQHALDFPEQLVNHWEPLELP